ncbi:uncharacterized protein [Primulina huaijiensis]|uniref:uncharacterized protein n=1 Tax=Primulina huaijiensis TaxID=1492673 RepID=UPI003CC73FEB
MDSKRKREGQIDKFVDSLFERTPTQNLEKKPAFAEKKIPKKETQKSSIFTYLSLQFGNSELFLTHPGVRTSDYHIKPLRTGVIAAQNLEKLAFAEIKNKKKNPENSPSVRIFCSLSGIPRVEVLRSVKFWASGVVYLYEKMAASVNREMVFLLLQFLDEGNLKMTARMLEKESGLFFNMRYFEEKINNGEWDEVESYLSSFTRVDENRHSTKIFFEIRKHKYLEALDKQDKDAAIEILTKDLKVFQALDENLYKDMTMLLTLNNFRYKFFNGGEASVSFFSKREVENFDQPGVELAASSLQQSKA